MVDFSSENLVHYESVSFWMSLFLRQSSWPFFLWRSSCISVWNLHISLFTMNVCTVFTAEHFWLVPTALHCSGACAVLQSNDRQSESNLSLIWIQCVSNVNPMSLHCVQAEPEHPRRLPGGGGGPGGLWEVVAALGSAGRDGANARHRRCQGDCTHSLGPQVALSGKQSVVLTLSKLLKIFHLLPTDQVWANYG